MKQPWRLRFYRDGDEKAIVELLDLVMPESNYSLERWLWEYKNNPYGFLAIVAEHGEQIVGHMALFLMDLKVGDRVIRGSQACDLAVHPDFRNQGMFLAMGKTLLERAGEQGILITYGFPNRPAYFGHLKYGWFDAARVPVLMSPYSTYSIVKGEYGKHPKLRALDPFMIRFSKFADYGLSRIRERRSRRARALLLETLKISEVKSFDERFDSLWTAVSEDYGAIVVRDHKYLKWRFSDRPDVHYRTLIAEKNGEIEGYIVLSVEESRYWRVGRIDDALSRNVNVARNLIESGLGILEAKGVDLVECWMFNNSIWYKLLREKGFIPMHFCIPGKKEMFIVRINSRRFFQYYKSMRRGWYLTYGDSDHAGGGLSIA